MARVCIANTVKTQDSSGAAIDSGISTTEGTAKRSNPVRLFGMDGEVRYLGLEFIYVGNYVADLDLRWFMEYFGDGPSLASPPNLRTALGLPANLPWARECSEIVGAAGAVTNSPVTRSLNFTVDPTGAGTAYYLPMVVHGLWGRVAYWSNGAPPANAQLQIYAHVGAHLEETYLESTGDIPYAYDA